MQILKKLAPFLAAGSLMFSFAAPALAVDVSTGLDGATATLNEVVSADGASSLAETNSLPVLIGRIINVILGLMGIFFLVMVVWAGIDIMLAQGDDDKVKGAIGKIRTAVIGMVVTVAAYAISSYVISAITTAVG